MKHLKILCIYIKVLLNLPIYRIDVLNWAKYWYVGKTCGLCLALVTSIDDLGLNPFPIRYYFAEYTKQCAKRFPCNYIGYGFWWESRTWDINGRLGFFYWLKDQYKDDRKNLRNINIEEI